MPTRAVIEATKVGPRARCNSSRNGARNLGQCVAFLYRGGQREDAPTFLSLWQRCFWALASRPRRTRLLLGSTAKGSIWMHRPHRRRSRTTQQTYSHRTRRIRQTPEPRPARRRKMTVFPPIAAIRAPFQTHPSKFGFCGGAHWYGCDRPYSRIALPAKIPTPTRGFLGDQRRVAAAERA